MIDAQTLPVRINMHFLADLLYQRDAIKALAVQIVASQAEAHLDMINDAGPVEYPTFHDVSDCVGNAKETAADYVEDLVAEFREALLAELKNVSIVTTAVRFTSSTVDADVRVSI